VWIVAARGCSDRIFKIDDPSDFANAASDTCSATRSAAKLGNAAATGWLRSQ
jgi:hypothetical protein